MDSPQVLPALAKVDETYQAAVTLYYLEDYSYKDIAFMLGVPVGTVKSRIARGIAQLREIVLSGEPRASTPLNGDTQNGPLVPVSSWNQTAQLDSHLCHSQG